MHLNKSNIFSLNRIHGYIRVKIDDAFVVVLKKTFLTFPDVNASHFTNNYLIREVR